MAVAAEGGAGAPTADRFGPLRLLRARESGVFIALFVLCVFLSFATDGFLTSVNLFNVGRQISLLGIMSVGMTFVLISGEVDLSVGSTYAISGLLSGMYIIAGYGLVLSLCVGMLSIVRGVALIMTNGQPVTVNAHNGARPDVLNAFEFMGQGYLFSVVPMQLVFFAAVAAVAWVILSSTNFGFRVFAVGGSAKAARVAGIHVNRVKISALVLMGALAAFSGILSIAFLPSGQAGRTGLGLELDVIAATIVGGSSLSGGEGTILGTILGVLIIGVMRNGLVLMGFSPFVQELMIGLVIIIAVGIDKWSSRMR
jgi:ribose transport system permease protein